jgi:anti-sigma factor RsiW
VSVQCVQLREGVVTDYLEGALSPTEVDAVEFHLVTCAPCAKLLHGHRQVSSLLQLFDPR